MRIAFIAADSPLAQAADLSGQPACLARALAEQGHRVTIYARQDGTTTGTAVLGRNVSVEFIPAGPARPLAPEQAVRYMPDLAAALVGRWVAKRALDTRITSQAWNPSTHLPSTSGTNWAASAS